MDYSNFDRGRPRLPAFIRRNMRYLRPVGLVFCAIGLLLPLLILVKVLTSTFLLNILAYFLLVLGPASYLVGLAFDGYVDRAE
jgi:hypothetical protein